MKITKTQLRQIIKEELETAMEQEDEIPGLNLVPVGDRKFFLPGKLGHRFIKKPGNEDLDAPEVLELYDMAMRELGRSGDQRRKLYAQHVAARKEGVPAEETPMMQWVMNRMQEIAG